MTVTNNSCDSQKVSKSRPSGLVGESKLAKAYRSTFISFVYMCLAKARGFNCIQFN